LENYELARYVTIKRLLSYPEERKAFFQCELARYIVKGCDRMQHIDYAVLDFLYIETE
jgi:hypothetical protein